MSNLKQHGVVKMDDLYRGGFLDGNGRSVEHGDRVEYRFGARRGKLIDAMHDGDAWVEFDDNPSVPETVKWHHLCKVPAWAEENPIEAQVEGGET